MQALDGVVDNNESVVLSCQRISLFLVHSFSEHKLLEGDNFNQFMGSKYEFD